MRKISLIAVLTAVFMFLAGCPVMPDVGETKNETGVLDEDEDGDGYTLEDGDCDDNDAAVNPGAEEVCDQIDNNCDSQVDEGLIEIWYADTDGDGFGDPEAVTQFCDLRVGYVSNNTDCDDSEPTVFPEATEYCDGLDNDCDVYVDEEAVDMYTQYADEDHDGFGSLDNPIQTCEPRKGYVDNATDCNDFSANISPDGVEICDEWDNDCDGQVDEGVQNTYYIDQDRDGYGVPTSTTAACDQPTGYASNTTDCNDANLSVNPSADETCNGLDDDCDGTIDVNAVDVAMWYQDIDGDGYGDVINAVLSCTQLVGYVSDAADCDDTRSNINPTAAEVCNSLDDDCDGLVDDADADLTGAPAWYADGDVDGYGDATNSVSSCLQPAKGYVADSTDCDDFDSRYHPFAREECGAKFDFNCDGTTGFHDLDGDTVPTCDGNGLGVDCNDLDATIYPGALEFCDGVDNNCDGVIDEPTALDAEVWFADADVDGYGDAANNTQSCTQPSGFVSDSSDCDDINSLNHPNALEFCDGVDNNCDGAVDENTSIDATTWYQDSDGDSYGVASVAFAACVAPTGYVALSGDCDDSNRTAYPGAPEFCDGHDDNCNNVIDEPSSVNATVWYLDADVDEYGTLTSITMSCTQPLGYVSDNTDCNDGNVDIHPNATETCDSVDSDCDGSFDDPDSVGITTWYADSDSDAFGNVANNTQSCTQPIGFVSNSTDCDDANASVHPGAADTCNGIDDDCDSQVDEGTALTWYEDADGDGYGNAASTTQSCIQPTGYVSDSTDCDDASSSAFPGNPEVCDGVDNDCNGTVDEGLGGRTTWYLDADSDGYGSSTSILACGKPLGYVRTSTDCDDNNASIHPNATEVCDGLDQDCDAVVDEDSNLIWYSDADSDGYGNVLVIINACSQPSGYVANIDDCDDTNAAINPEADELCDGVDDDCNGDIDDVWECEDIDTDGILNSEDLIDLVDADGDGGIDACVPGFLVLAAPYSTASTYIQFQNASYNTLVNVLAQNGDVDGDGVLDSWCVSTTGSGEWSFRLVSTLSASNSADQVGVSDCQDWKIPSFSNYCTTYSDCCVDLRVWDGCRYIGWVPYVHDDGTDLSCP